MTSVYSGPMGDASSSLRLFLLLAVLCGKLAVPATAQQWQGFLVNAPPYATGDRPESLTTADFNGDGITDIAITNGLSDNVSVLLGNGSGGVGDGTFGTQTAYATGDTPTRVTTGDFNSDGITDLATANRDSDDVSVLLGNGSGGVGDGTFAPQVVFSVGDAPSSMTTGDFNGDGITDLATTNLNSDSVSVVLGNGNGTFGAQINSSAGVFIVAVTTGDFNGDGNTDIATANYLYGNVSVLLGNGDGTFAEDVLYGVGAAPIGIATGDFNGDGITDLAAANLFSDDVSVLLGNGSGGIGDGTFSAQATYPTWIGPHGFTTGDFNGDGITDFATANYYLDFENVSVLLGNGSGGIGDGTFATAITYFVADRPTDLTTGDFDGDGIPDLATTHKEFDNFSVLLNQGFNDVTAPTSLVNGPNGPLTQPSPLFSVTFTAEDSHLGATGVAGVRLFYQRNGGGFRLYFGGTFTSSPIAFDITGTGGNGTYDFYTIAIDGAGNSELKAPAAEATAELRATSGASNWQYYGD